MIYLCIKFYYFYLFLFTLVISVLSDNIDLEFPVIFTHQNHENSASNSKLQQSSESYFGYTVSVNHDNGNN